eukprot:4759718-Pyramimonas_sp.AAC.1
MASTPGMHYALFMNCARAAATPLFTRRYTTTSETKDMIAERDRSLRVRAQLRRTHALRPDSAILPRLRRLSAQLTLVRRRRLAQAKQLRQDSLLEALRRGDHAVAHRMARALTYAKVGAKKRVYNTLLTRSASSEEWYQALSQDGPDKGFLATRTPAPTVYKFPDDLYNPVHQRQLVFGQ